MRRAPRAATSTILATRSCRKEPSAADTWSMSMRTMSARLRFVTMPDTCPRRRDEGIEER